MKAMDTGAAIKRERPVVSRVEVLLRVAFVGGAALGIESLAGWRGNAFVAIVRVAARG
jgi:hypothetical protein